MPRKANKKKPSPKPRVVSKPREARSRPILALLFFALSLMAIVAIWDFELSQSVKVKDEPEQNLVGFLGAEGSFWSFYFLGVATWLVPFYLGWLGVRFFVKQPPRRRLYVVLAAALSLISGAGLVGMVGGVDAVAVSVFEHQVPEGYGLGGNVGWFVSSVLLDPIGRFGASLVLLLGFVAGWVVVFTNNLGRLVDWLQQKYRAFWEGRAQSKEARKELKAERLEARKEVARAKAAARAERAAAKLEKKKKKKSQPSEPITESDPFEDLDTDDRGRRPSLLSGAPKFPAQSAPRKSTKKSAVKQPAEEPPEVEEPAAKKPPLDPNSIKIIRGEETEKAVASIPERRGDYVFPPLELLNEANEDGDFRTEDHAGTMQALVRTLDEFGVKVIPGEIHTGPVITRYEVTPAPGVRVEKIVNLDKNIALGLKAMSVRILAPVPGKGTVGIEVPNKSAQPVCMRDIVESKSWAEADAEIPVVLGKDVTGKPLVTDLTKMPHVLIAGSTGSGKTVCINAIIASLLYHSGPDDLRFIMVDPKVVEMQMYNSLPHMLIPVVTEPKKVPGALKWLIAEMDRRYQIFASENVRNIAGFNAKIAKNKEEQAKAEAMDADMSAEERAAIQQIEVPRDDDAFEIPKKKLPYIVCVIDELADLMMVAPADIETCIARLAQLARAAGIHLILATQRPSVNVITGVIKANLPSRISFKVASKVDSRTILDGGGAEALIGKGDMLFIPPGTSTLVRAQGAFVSDDEINAIVEFLKEKNDPPVFAEEVQKQIDAGGDEEGGGPGGDDGGDEMLSDAINVLRSTKRASTSMLQRRLRIGYNRAARLMEELEERGIVGPENGSSPREIMVDLDTM